MRIPFNFSFGHGAAKRTTSDSFILKLESEEGLIGYGEGLPRSYVTGETLDTSCQFFKESLSPLIKTSSFQFKSNNNLQEILENIHNCFFKNINFQKEDNVSFNSIKCATEMALLDLVLQKEKKSLNNLISPNNKVNYSCILPFFPLKYLGLILRFLKFYKFKQIKVKTNAQDDEQRLKKIRNILGNEVEIRIDGNSIYDRDSFTKNLPIFKKYNVSWIEQPFHKNKHDEIVSHFSQREIPFMADESLCTLKDGEHIINNKTFDLFNLRISKNGGLKDSLALFEMAKKAGLGYQVGAQVGETALLSCLGRSFAYHIDPIAIEGSAGNLLLKKDISVENIRFKKGGLADVLKNQPHFGVTINSNIIEKYGNLAFAL